MTPILAQRSRTDRAFERLYRRHVADVYRYALAVMRNQPDAEDVTQTTFMNAYRAFQRGERPEKPQNWLIAIAHNVCRQRFRQSARRPTEVSFDEDIGDGIVGGEEDESPSAEDIRRALGHLAFNQRAALVMRELEGRTYVEIAEILELSPAAVETVIFRARRALREQLESTLTCGEAELAVSRQLDGRLPRKEKGALRAHLRECKECATFARRQRAQRSALRSLGAVPVPASLTSLFGGGGSAVGTGVALKAAVAVTAGAVVGGAGYEGVHHVVRQHQHRVARSASAPARPTAVARPRVVVVPPRAGASARTRAVKPQVVVSVNGKHAKATANGRGHVSHGDASVAARHTHVKPSHPATGTGQTRRSKHANAGHKAGHAAKTSRAKGSPRHTTTPSRGHAATTPAPGQTKSKKQMPPGQLPGPYDGAPPPPDDGHHGKPSKAVP
jgi:RNA polymerase sigma factor (sigma-70 family)